MQRKYFLFTAILSMLATFLSVCLSANAGHGETTGNEAATMEIKELIDGYFNWRYNSFLNQEVLHSQKTNFIVPNSNTNREIDILEVEVAKNIIYGSVLINYRFENMFKEIDFESKDKKANVAFDHYNERSYADSDSVSSSEIYYTMEVVLTENGWRIVSIHTPYDKYYNSRDFSKKSKEEIIEGFRRDREETQKLLDSKKNDIGSFNDVTEPLLQSGAWHAYNRNAAVAYAAKYVYNYNPAYYDFSGDGGDCTNFASQVIHLPVEHQWMRPVITDGFITTRLQTPAVLHHGQACRSCANTC